MQAKARTVVFGGTGFLGRRIVRQLLDRDKAVRIAVRRPERGSRASAGQSPQPEFLRADVNDESSVRAAVSGAFAVVNAVSLYVERGGLTFHSFHVEAAARVARLAREARAARLVHVSGIGADAGSSSPYIRSRGEGEEAVRAAFPGASVVRPAVMFGPDDALLAPLAALLRRLPVFPMFGNGRTRLQPADVEDVAEAVTQIVRLPDAQPVYELGGPRVYTYEELLRTIGEHIGVRRPLVPVPFGLWRALALGAELLPSPPITRNQVDLMAFDNVASPDCPGFGAFGIAPRGIEAVLARLREPFTRSL